MNGIPSIDKIIVDHAGKIRNVNIAESPDSATVIIFNCTFDDGEILEVMLDDNGNWVEKQYGVTEQSIMIGNIIDDHFD